MQKVIIITLLLLITFSSSLKSQEGIENLFDELKAAHHDTTRANTLLKIAQLYANNNPDSSFYWLSRIYLLEQNESLTTAAIDYYKGLAHIEKAKVYILHNRDLNLALQQNDSAISIFYPLLKNKPNKYLANKILQGLATAYSLNGKVYLLTGSLNSSINSYESALKVLDSLDHKIGVAKMNNNLGVLNRRISNYPKAIEHFQAALNYFQSNNDTVAVASILTNMGAVSHDIGAYEKSLENYFSALAMLEKFNEDESVALTLVNIGGVLVDSKNVLESISYYNRALAIFEELKDKRGRATTLLSIGVAYKEAEILDSASLFLLQAEKLYKQNSDKMGQADALYEMGQVLLKQQKYSDARYNLSMALELAQKINFQSVISGVQYHLAVIEYKLGNFEKAKLYALKAVDSSHENNMLSLQKDAHGLLSSIYEEMSEVGLSLKHHKQYFALNDSLYILHSANKFAEMEALYRLEQKELEIQKLQHENELKDVLLHNAELKILWQKAHTY
ncbi:MAG TPA: tetratricopeptide repeat protein, partial [Bacteroidetes bacterium]|nr:tetratricopeptide repeat protein [Bacteroidota bacterium]